MKKTSKHKVNYWGVSIQLNNRPTKNAKGMSFTNERRARSKGKSIFYQVILSRQRTTNDARKLTVRGTIDSLAYRNSVTSYNWRRYKKGLKQQRKGTNSNIEYHKKLATLIVH